MPSNETFTHTVYINAAKAIYSDPYIFGDDISGASETLISASILQSPEDSVGIDPDQGNADVHGLHARRRRREQGHRLSEDVVEEDPDIVSDDDDDGEEEYEDEGEYEEEEPHEEVKTCSCRFPPKRRRRWRYARRSRRHRSARDQ